MDDDLDQLLRGLKLSRIREVLPEHLARAEADGPSYADFLRRLLRAEYQDQQVRFLSYRIKRASLPEHWALESFPWDQQPGVQRAMIEQLARLDFLARAGNVVFVGPTGVGKTGLSIGLLLKALEALRNADADVEAARVDAAHLPVPTPLALRPLGAGEARHTGKRHGFLAPRLEGLSVSGF